MVLPYNLNRFGGGKRRPYYCEVEWIQTPATSTNTSFFETNMYPSVGTSITMLVIPDNWTTRRITGASGTQSGGAGATFVDISTNGYWGCGTQGTVAASTTKVQKVKMKFNTNSHELYVDDTLALTYNLNIPHTTDPYYWGLGAMTGSTGYRMPAKWYRAYQEDENGQIIHDLIPVLDWNMKPCMYDKVTGKFFYKTQIVSSGTIPELNYGREIHYVEYLESTGTQYINTGYIPNINTETREKFIVKNSEYAQCTAFTRWSYAPNYDTFGTYIPAGGSSCNVYYGRFSGGKLFTKNFDFLNQEVEIETNKNSIVFNGQATAVTRSSDEWTNTSYPLYLFAGNNVGVLQFQSRIQMKSYKISENGVLKRDYLPAVDETGKGFMFDKVEHKIYDNAGTGDFKYPEIELEYLQSTGTQYINTGKLAPTGTEIYAKFQMDNIATSAIFGGRTSGGGTCSLFCIGGTSPYFRFDRTSQLDVNPNTPNTDSIYEFRYYDTTKIYVKDLTTGEERTVNINPPGTFSEYPIYLFGVNTSGSAGSGAKMKYFAWQYKSNGVLQQDFVPMLKDGTVGMYDRVSGTMYTKVGSGNFKIKVKEKK